MESQANGSEQLVKRVQNLPQELQDMIFDFTIESPSCKILIDRLYRPPSYLQINRATRDKAAKNYYNSTCFLVKYVPGGFSRPAWKWLKSLSTAHFLHIAEVRILGCGYPLGMVSDWYTELLESCEENMSGDVGATLQPQHKVIRWEFYPRGCSSRSEAVWFTLQELSERLKKQ